MDGMVRSEIKDLAVIVSKITAVGSGWAIEARRNSNSHQSSRQGSLPT